MSDKVTMTALDTMHISNVSANNLQKDDVFTVSESDAKRLEAAGLAERGGTASKAVNVEPVASDRPDTREEIDAERGQADGAKAISAAPANKAVAASDNKAAITTPAKSAAKRK